MEYLEKLETIANTGAPGAIRTPDLRNRNPSLYPAELRVLGGGLDFQKILEYTSIKGFLRWIEESRVFPFGKEIFS